MKGFRFLLLCCAVIAAGCDGGVRSPDFLSETTVESFEVKKATSQPAGGGDLTNLPIGRQVRLEARATLSHTVPPGTTGAQNACPAGNSKPAPVTCEENKDVTADSTWTSSNESIATVVNGLVTGRSIGDTTITATYMGKTDSVDVHVTAAVLESIGIVRDGTTGPALTAATMTKGSSAVFRAVGFYSGSSTPVNLDTATWASNAPTIATVTTPGPTTTVSAVEKSPPAARVTATASGKTASMDVTVTETTLLGVRRIRPQPDFVPPTDTPTVYVPLATPNLTKEFVAVGMTDRSDRSKDFDLNDNQIAWSSSDVAVAPIDASGVATAKAQGTAIITGALKPTVANSGTEADRSKTATLVVTDPVCTRPFLQSTGATVVDPATTFGICLMCGVTNPNSAIDNDLTTAATMSVPVGLLNAGLDFTVIGVPEGSPSIAGGKTVGFLISRPAGTLVSAELMSQLTVATFKREGTALKTTSEESTDLATPGTIPEIPLRVTLLGQLGGLDVAFVGFQTTKPYDALRLTFNGGVATALGTVDVNSSCEEANPPPAE